jgi:hypothetical protein
MVGAFLVSMLATVPGGHAYLGVSVSGAQGIAPGYRASIGIGFGVELHAELEHIFAGLTGQAGTGGGLGANGHAPTYLMLGGRIGWAFLTAEASPYLAGLLMYGGHGQRVGDDGPVGVFVGGELGGLFFRQLRFGRLVLAAQVLVPLFSPDPRKSDSMPDVWVLGTIRFLL